MKKFLFKMIMTVFIILWLIVTIAHYIGVYPKVKTDPMSAFLYSLILFSGYVLILYGCLRFLSTLYYLVKYRKIKVKYMDNPTFFKQLIYLFMAVFLIYGLCSMEYYFIGLIPILLFFYKKFISTGKLYIYYKDELLYMDENAKEYIVKSINSSENKVVIQHKKKSSLKTIALKQKKNNKEEEFLYSINLFTSENKEVA
ncbi:MAG: hypothetical protein K0S76_1843 [Herbinix sp.]|nr:hypothetical protein [Herbinix sp.]